VPMISLLLLIRRKTIMGAFASRRLTLAAATVATGVVLLLNGLLILATIGLPVFGPPAG